MAKEKPLIHTCLVALIIPLIIIGIVFIITPDFILYAVQSVIPFLMVFGFGVFCVYCLCASSRNELPEWYTGKGEMWTR